MSKINIVEHTGLVSVLGKLSLQTIPENALIDGVVRELRDREAFKDADPNHNERIYHGDIFEQILGEQSMFEDDTTSPMRLSQKVLDQLEVLSKMVTADYILVSV